MPAVLGESALHNALPDILVYLSAITSTLSLLLIFLPLMFPASLSVSSSGISVSSHVIANPVSPSQLAVHMGEGHMSTPAFETARISVPKSCMKEGMPCKVSYLGYNQPMSVKENIWMGEFVDVLSLLPATKEFILQPDKGEDMLEGDRPIPHSFNNCL